MTRVTAKYQITIPVEVRKELGIIPGSEVDIARAGDMYVLIARPVESIRKKWRGKFKDGKTSDAYMNEVRGAIE